MKPQVFLAMNLGGEYSLRRHIAAGVLCWWNDAYSTRGRLDQQHGFTQRDRHLEAALDMSTKSDDWYLVVDDDIMLLERLRTGAAETWVEHIDRVMRAFPKIGMARPILVPDDHPNLYADIPVDAGFIEKWGAWAHGGELIAPIGGWRVVRNGAIPDPLPPQVGNRYDHTLCKAMMDAGWKIGVLPGLMAHDLGWQLSTIT